MKQTLDYDRMSTNRLFSKLFFPTLLGLFSGSLMNVTDGIFVGRQAGSDALAAINIAAPIYMMATGLALMFGIGASVLASISLAQNRKEDANLHITRSVVASTGLMLTISLLSFIFKEELVNLFGCTPRLLPLAVTYMSWTAPFMVFNCLMFSGIFHIRLDGAPRYAMVCELIPAALNIFLDYLFIFPLGWGIKGAAIASSISLTLGGLMVLTYLLFFTKRVQLTSIKSALSDGMAFLCTVWAQIKLGFSALLGELAISVMLVAGNYAFGRQLGEDGVAAYSIACYCTPLLFMINSAIAQSIQPIISYDYGAGRWTRVRQALRLALIVSVLCGTLSMLLMTLFCGPLVYLFVGDGCATFDIAVKGLPYFSIGIIFMAFNVVMIGYYQSIEKARKATLFTLLRGYLFLIVCFLALPAFIGELGLWLAIPVAEALTASVLIAFAIYTRRKKVPSIFG